VPFGAKAFLGQDNSKDDYCVSRNTNVPASKAKKTTTFLVRFVGVQKPHNCEQKKSVRLRTRALCGPDTVSRLSFSGQMSLIEDQGERQTQGSRSRARMNAATGHFLPLA
jgi:hypothetical protein